MVDWTSYVIDLNGSMILVDEIQFYGIKTGAISSQERSEFSVVAVNLCKFGNAGWMKASTEQGEEIDENVGGQSFWLATI